VYGPFRAKFLVLATRGFRVDLSSFGLLVPFLWCLSIWLAGLDVGDQGPFGGHGQSDSCLRGQCSVLDVVAEMRVLCMAAK
jgi:hypothetical protein